LRNEEQALKKDSMSTWRPGEAVPKRIGVQGSQRGEEKGRWGGEAEIVTNKNLQPSSIVRPVMGMGIAKFQNREEVKGLICPEKKGIRDLRPWLTGLHTPRKRPNKIYKDFKVLRRFGSGGEGAKM